MNLGLAALNEMKNKPAQRNKNHFSLGSQVGGADAAIATGHYEQELRDAMNRWSGDYSAAVREFAFVLRVDGAIHAYTKEWNIQGAQGAKRKKDWIEVEIGVPRSSWEENKGRTYKEYLVTEIDKGLRSMIEVLLRSGAEVNKEALLGDWEKLKRDYLSGGPTTTSRVQ